ncbi:MAG TPA: MaoC family dehydratase [Stellaceae bacterium]|nr:MaoC family dehydratase [Stellaceae bacterium]
MSPADFAVPIEDRWFEDFVPGAVYEFGRAEVSAAEIVDFASRFDPQPMHVDPQMAAEGSFGGLIASGWQTAGLMMRLFVDHFLPGHASIASPGIDELRWTRPVRPGDVLRLRVHVLEATRSRSRPDRGLVRTLIEVLNQNGETVMSLKPMNLVRCRPANQERPA